jgi:hypothetical protein
LKHGHPSAPSLLLMYESPSLVSVSFGDKVIFFFVSLKVKNGTEGFYNLEPTFIRDIVCVVIQPVTTSIYTCQHLNALHNGQKTKLNWEK